MNGKKPLHVKQGTFGIGTVHHRYLERGKVTGGQFVGFCPTVVEGELRLNMADEAVTGIIHNTPLHSPCTEFMNGNEQVKRMKGNVLCH